MLAAAETHIFINIGANTDIQNERGYTALMIACANHRDEVVKLLIKKGADANVQCMGGFTAFTFAINLQMWSIVPLLLGVIKPEHIDFKYHCGNTPLILGCKNTSRSLDKTSEILIVKALQELIVWGADVGAVNKRGYTPFLYAVENGNCAIVKFFLSMNVNVDQRNENKQTALILAAKQKYPEIIDLLIQHGCDSNVKDRSGKTALYYAVHSQCSRTMQTLIRGGVSPLGVENYFLKSSLDTAESHYRTLDKEVNTVWGRRDIVKRVYYYQSNLSGFARILDGPNFNIDECIFDNGWTLLHLAVYFNRVELVKLLLEKNAAITKSSKLVKKESFLSKFCSLILRWPWMANHTRKSTDDDGQRDQTPLHIACARGYVECLSLLLAHIQSRKELEDMVEISLSG